MKRLMKVSIVLIVAVAMLSVGGLSMASNLGKQVSAPVAPTMHVDSTSGNFGPSPSSAMPRPHAVEQSFNAVGGCRGWNGVVIPCTATVLEFGPGDVNTYMFDAWVEGEGTAAFWECLNHSGDNLYSLAFSDCYGLLTWLASYSYPIMQWWAHFGAGVGFSWGSANQYIGWFAF